MRSYAGKVEKFPSILADVLDNKEVVVPCMVDGDKEALHKKTARIQRLKASLKILDYNPKRDFVGWGGEEIRRLAGMAGFDKYASLPKLDAEAQSVTTVDFDNDGKPDICLCGANKVVLLQNGGDGFIETALPGFSGGARAAVWADHNGDGLPDLLLATPTGPRLFTNLGKGQFREDTNRLPKETAYDLTAAAWGDFDGDGKPDILLANGFHGLRLYKNIRRDEPKIVPPKFGDWYAIGMFRAANPADNFKTEFPIEKDPFTREEGLQGQAQHRHPVEEDAVQGRHGREPHHLRPKLRELLATARSNARPRPTSLSRSAPTTRSRSGSMARSYPPTTRESRSIRPVSIWFSSSIRARILCS